MIGKVQIIVLLLVVAALPHLLRASAPTPRPPDGELNLSRSFTGLTAVEDASLVASLCAEIADVIDWDAAQVEPILTTGIKLDSLRVRSREMLCRGESIGDRQPKMRDAVARYLDSHLGIAGGPVTPEVVAAWSRCYREIARAAYVAAH